MSKWSGELTAAEVACMKAAGIRKILVGTGNPAPGGAGQWARQQAASALAHGLIVDAYIYLYLAKAPGTQTRIAMGTLKGLPIGRWWLDAEDMESPELSPQQRVSYLAACADIVAEAGGRAGIYTGRWWWVPNTGDSRWLMHLPLWNAWFDGDPDTDGLPYGGWTDSLIEQYQGTTVVCGQSVDLNYDKSLVEEDEMTDEEFAARMAKVGKDRGWWDDLGPVDKSLRDGLTIRNALRKLADDQDIPRSLLQKALAGALAALVENTEE
jgi:hypothetical protein